MEIACSVSGGSTPVPETNLELTRRQVLESI